MSPHLHETRCLAHSTESIQSLCSPQWYSCQKRLARYQAISRMVQTTIHPRRYIFKTRYQRDDEGWDAVQLVECLTSMQKVLGSILMPHKIMHSDSCLQSQHLGADRRIRSSRASSTTQQVQVQPDLHKTLLEKGREGENNA